MWLLKLPAEGGKLDLHHFASPAEVEGSYAILSHVHASNFKSCDVTEHTFQDIQGLQARGATYEDLGSGTKLRNCVGVARRCGFAWLWIDTCCIDRTSSAELEEAVNSMFSWYAGAQICFAYLFDVPNSDESLDAHESAFRKSKWFKRCWTLPELLASRYLIFMSQNWKYLGTKSGLARLLQEITGIDAEVLTFNRSLENVSVACKMSWAASREATRVEDEAYSLLGLFAVYLPTIYGEGRRAFRRLQEEILRHSTDPTLFAWGHLLPSGGIPQNRAATSPLPHAISSLFAPTPSAFKESGSFRMPTASTIRDNVGKWFDVTEPDTIAVREYAISSHSVRCCFDVIEGSPFSLAILECKNDSDRWIGLLLWPTSQSTKHCAAYSVGEVYGPSTNSTSKGSHEEVQPYRLIAMGSKTLAILKSMGWIPGLPRDSTDSAKPKIRAMEVYIADTFRPRAALSGVQAQPKQPEVLIPAWLRVYLARLGFELEQEEPTGIMGRRVRPPLAITFARRPKNAGKLEGERFRVEVKTCGHGKLVVTVVVFSQEYALDAGIFGQRNAQAIATEDPFDVLANGPRTYVHIKTWKAGSISFGDPRRLVTLAAAKWPDPDTYCLELLLDGDIYTRRKSTGKEPTSTPPRGPSVPHEDTCASPPRFGLAPVPAPRRLEFGLRQ
ncbi:hypothetical protein OH77DRAFT_176879 [Trametes cingulata]|nr:hypothetical protein OH77DRAFT_176879 [Trametes cingulata]